MKSAAGYVLGVFIGLLLLAAGIVLVLFAFINHGNRVESFQRFELQGVPGTVELRQAGAYSIYFEPGDEGPQFTNYREPPFLVEVSPNQGVGASEPLDVEGYDNDVTYDVSGYEGIGVYTFTSAYSRTYTVAVVGSAGGSSVDGSGTVAVGRGIGTAFPGFVTAGIGLIGLGPLVGASLVVLTLSRHRRRL
ncbi:MAG: hypothetical protein H0U26_06445 [Acidimicrobiia bacterium]|nr:hypothetical protein [Acidimicrobiia bacterium]